MRGKKKWCEETRETILRFIRMGFHREIAAARAKVSDTTLAQWMSRGGIDSRTYDEYIEAGEDPDDPDAPQHTDYAQFYEALCDAEAQAQIELVQPILESADLEDRKWVAERRFHKQWSTRGHQRVEVSGPDGKPIEMVDARRELLKRLDGMIGRDVGEE